MQSVYINCYSTVFKECIPTQYSYWSIITPQEAVLLDVVQACVERSTVLCEGDLYGEGFCSFTVMQSEVLLIKEETERE